MNNETIKDQVRRLIAGIAPCYGKSPDLIKDDDYCFGFMVQVVELAIAEEREAYKSAYQALREMFNDGEELECDDGWRVGVDIDLWSLGVEAFDGLEAPAPKDEVNQ